MARKARSGRKMTAASAGLIAMFVLGPLLLSAPATYAYDIEPLSDYATPWFESVPLNPRAVAWSPDGSMALLAGGGTVSRYDGSAFETIFSDDAYTFNGIAWNPKTGGAIVVGSRGASGVALQYYRGTTTWLSHPAVEAHMLSAAAWHPSGTACLMVGSSGVIVLYERDNFTVVPLKVGITDVPSIVLRAVAWHPSGTYALIAGTAYDDYIQTQQALVLRYQNGSVSRVQTDASGVVWDIAWGAGCETVLVGEGAGLEAGSGLVMLYTGGTLTTLIRGVGAPLYGVSWNPAITSCLIVGHGTLLEYDGVMVKPLFQIGDGPILFDCSWDPTGNTALLCGADKTVLEYNPYKTMTDRDGNGLPDAVQKFKTGGPATTSKRGFNAMYFGGAATLTAVVILSCYLMACWWSGRTNK